MELSFVVIRARARMEHSPSFPERGVSGWAILLRAMWTQMDDLVALARQLHLATVRMTGRRAALYADVAESMGCVSPAVQILPSISGLPSTLPPPTGSRHEAYAIAAARRDRCEHSATSKPYTAAKIQWLKCNVCGRRWRSSVHGQTDARWVIDDRDDPNRTPASTSTGSAASTSSSVPFSKGGKGESRKGRPPATPAGDEDWGPPATPA